ncbi:MAG TPA: PHP domain-containing protein [Ruminococcaceae bacterium]|nr:PHP domain-containing protein [Oscillospiraceae bacterium]
MQSVKSLILRNDFAYIKDMFIYFLSLCLFVVIFRLTHDRRKIKSRNPLAESAKKEYNIRYIEGLCALDIRTDPCAATLIIQHSNSSKMRLLSLPGLIFKGGFILSVDLHCHTKLSNSSMGIDDLIMLAKKRGVDTISITDHDCQAGSVRGRIIAARRGVTVVPGVELSASDAETGRQVHILGYFCDSPDRLEELCHKNNAARKKAGQYMILKAAQRYPISAELVMKCAAGSTGIFEEHIMHALVECGITQDFHGEIYDELFNPESPKNIVVEPKFIGVKEVIDAIHGAGGIAVLAHPYKYNSVPGLDRYVEYGIDGIEVWCPSSSEEQQKDMLDYAKSHKLLAIGGSDFSGMYNRGTVSIGDFNTPAADFKALSDYKAMLKKRAK